MDKRIPSRARKLAIGLALLMGAAAVAIAAGARSSDTEPRAGSFHRVEVAISYGGAEYDLSYEAWCYVQATVQRDGDVSVDRGAVVPPMWGRTMPDGGAVVVVTPNVCRAGPDGVADVSNPWLIHYADASEPWFGLAYIRPEAYRSPIAVIRAASLSIEPSNEESWASWEATRASQNFVTAELLKYGDGPWGRTPWKPGMNILPTACSYAEVTRLDQDSVKRVAALRTPGSTDYWSSQQVLSERLTSLSGSTEVYPARSAMGVNHRGSDGAWRTDTIPHGIYWSSIDMRPDLNGFAYCDYDSQRRPWQHNEKGRLQDVKAPRLLNGVPLSTIGQGAAALPRAILGDNKLIVTRHRYLD